MDEFLTNFLIRLSIDEELLASYAALTTDDERREFLEGHGLSKAAIDAILHDDDAAIRQLLINQNNQGSGINQNNQNNASSINQNNQNNNS